MSTVSDTGLYYPYANFRSDAWIKAAVLHWPLVGRIMPITRPWSLDDSDTVRELRDELGVIVDVLPGREAEEDVQWVFFTVLDRNAAELRRRFGLEALPIGEAGPSGHDRPPRSLDPQLDAVHGSKITYRLAQRLVEAGLLCEAPYGWTTASGRRLGSFDYVMHRKLAGVYMALLADRTAEANKMIPITDQPDMHASMAGWEPESLAHMLLADPTDTPPPTAGEIGQAFAVMAFRTVVPHDLEHVPVSHIVEARKRLQPQLLEYRAYLKSLSDFFAEIAEIAEIPDANAREAQLRLKVEVEITSRVEKMQGEITRLGLKPAHAVLNLQTLAPPTVIGALTTAAGVPSPVTGVAVAAGCVAGAAISALRQRNEVRQDHAVGYLMSVNSKLSPTDTVQKVRSILRRANPAAHRHGLDAPRRSPEL